MAIDFPGSPTNGQIYANYIYDSSITAWRNLNTDTGVAALNMTGLKNVVPTSISVGSGSGVVNSNGTVTFSGATSISLNGVFTSTYLNYRINVNITSTSGGSGSFAFRLRGSGSDRTDGNYITSGTQAVSAGGISSWTSVTTFYDVGYLYSTPTSFSSYSLEVLDALPAIRTKMRGFSNGLSSGGVASTWTTGGLHNVDQAHDGFSILGTGSTELLNGTMTVYGYNN